MMCKSIDWFLYEGNTGTQWFKQNVKLFELNRYWDEELKNSEKCKQDLKLSLNKPEKST